MRTATTFLSAKKREAKKEDGMYWYGMVLLSPSVRTDENKNNLLIL